ncbi:MAG: DUF4249 domain-containing protein [Bacteroidota bacterium]|nr:DUF4249 domain-containing protein [Bacteroidota bacterium]
MRWFCLAAVILLAGCETVIEIDPPEYDRELTVISYFNSDSTWSARIAQTVPVGMVHADADRFLEDAKVTVWDGDRLIDQLTYDGYGTGWYASPNRLRPKIGVDYTLRVEASGFQSARATSAIPAIPELSHSGYEQIEADQFKVFYRLTDPPGDNYYSFNAYLGYPLTSNATGRLEYILDLLYMVRTDNFWHCSYVYAADPLPDFEEDDDLCLHGIMTDRLFDGQSQDMELSVLLEPDEQWVLIVMIHSLSPSFFEYKRTIQLDELSNPFSEPVQIYSNFEGARGVFAGFSTNYLVFNLTGVG